MISSTLIFCIACSSFNFNTENNVEETELKIMTSTPILADWVNQITDNQPAVKSIMPYGVDPHSYTPGAKDIADIAEFQTPDNIKVIELIGHDDTHHHHIFCGSCGSVTDFEITDQLETDLEKEIQKIEDKYALSVISHSLELLSLCVRCQEK